MTQTGITSLKPLKYWVLWVSLLGLSSLSYAAGGPQFPVQLSVPTLSDSAAQEALERFRSQHLAQDCALKIALEPRGKSTGLTYRGLFLASWRNHGLIGRIELATSSIAPLYRLLIQQGPNPSCWKAIDKAVPAQIPENDWLTALFPGLPYTSFDFLMPFVYWPFVYASSERSGGRIVHHYDMQPPAEFIALGQGYVRLTIDGGFYTLNQAACFDTQGNLTRTLKVGSFKKIQDQWIVKTLELVEAKTKAKARLTLEAAALNLALPPVVFNPSHLAEPLPDLKLTYQSL